MEEIEFYKSNSGLGHRQYAVFLMLKNRDLLVVNTDCMTGDMYSVGQVVHDNEEECVFIEKTNYDINKCEFLNSYLGRYFMKNYFNLPS